MACNHVGAARRGRPQARRSRPSQSERVDPADLAAGYMFPELFQDEPLLLRSQEVTERPFAPSAAVQYTIPDLPPVDWEHIRKKQAEQRRARSVGRARRNRPPTITAPAPTNHVDAVFKPRIVIEPIEREDGQP